MPSRGRPRAIAIVSRHGSFRTGLQPGLHRVGGAPHHLLRPDQVIAAQGFQHPGARLHASRWPSDPQAKPAEIARAQLIDDVLQSALPACAAAGPDAQGPGRLIEVVQHHQQTFPFNAPVAQQAACRLAAAVHVTLGFGQNDGVTPNSALRQSRAMGAATELQVVSSRQFVQHKPADVVTRPLVPAARVAQADDQPALAHAGLPGRASASGRNWVS